MANNDEKRQKLKEQQKAIRRELARLDKAEQAEKRAGDTHIKCVLAGYMLAHIKAEQMLPWLAKIKDEIAPQHRAQLNLLIAEIKSKASVSD